jgi:hypothetical protein
MFKKSQISQDMSIDVICYLIVDQLVFLVTIKSNNHRNDNNLNPKRPKQIFLGLETR